jgi:hypothetical protein
MEGEKISSGTSNSRSFKKVSKLNTVVAAALSQEPCVEDNSSKTVAGRFPRATVIEMQWVTDDNTKDEDIAAWLGSPIAGVKEVASQIVPIFLIRCGFQRHNRLYRDYKILQLVSSSR